MSCRHCCLFCSCAAAASCPPFPCHRAASHHPVQAYYFDAALTFGKQGYLGTGRDFVLRHLSFDDTFRAAGAYTQVQQLCGSGVVLLVYVSLRLPLSPLTPMSASSMAPPACLPACSPQPSVPGLRDSVHAGYHDGARHIRVRLVVVWCYL